MKEKKKEYIEFDDFVSYTGLRKSTVERNYKKIPGIEKKNDKYTVLSGTRYWFSDLHRYKIDDSYQKRYVLLKAISKFRYISHKELRIEKPQFDKMLRDLLSAGLIEQNNLSNSYGANAYDVTDKGAALMHKSDKTAKVELVNIIAEAAGRFTGAVISQIYDVA